MLRWVRKHLIRTQGKFSCSFKVIGEGRKRTVEPVAEAATPEPPTAKARDILIHDAALEGNIEAIKQHLAAGTDVNAKSSNDALKLTPLDAAFKSNQTELSDVLRKHGGKTGDELKAEGK